MESHTHYHHCRRLQLLFLPFLLIVLPSALSDLSASRSALLTLRSSLGGRTLVLWNPSSSSSICSWSGVQCLNDTAVVALRLPGVALSGQIPSGIFTNLSSLRTLSLRFNSLSGQIPSDLASCVQLRNLYLQGNKFSGEIPAFISSLQYLVRLNLARNSFTGTVQSSLNNLTRLRTLYLQDNQLNGTLPDLKLQLDQFNVTNNLLTGTIPVALSSMPVDAFSGNHLCGKPLPICPGIAAGTGEITGVEGGGAVPRKRKGLPGWAIAAIVVGSLVVLALLLTILLCVCFNMKNQPSRTVEFSSLKRADLEVPEDKLPPREPENVGYSALPVAASPMSVSTTTTTTTEKAAAAAAAAELNGFDGGIKKLVFFGTTYRAFDLEELLRASAEVLGKGTFGTAYKAVLEIGPVVAVKRLKDVTIPEQEFREKIEAVGAVEHQNLVPLRAYYYSRDEKLLVYDYMSMGSLSALLHGNRGAGRTPLNWEMRARIALGAARGISYLHSKGPTVSHGNIKASNILLTKSNEARVSDFGLAHLVGPSSTPNRVAGYRAPEVTDPRKVSQKADVYSFGVLLLELLTGKAPTHALLNEEGVDLPRWVQSVVKEEWTSEVFDLELLRYENVEEEMVQLLQLAVDCASQHPDSRPSMPEVTKRIEDLCTLSLLPEQEDFNSASVSQAEDGSFQ